MQKRTGLISFGGHLIDALIEEIRTDYSHIYNITPEQFELVICNLLEKNNYEVFRPDGGATHKDGGIDIYAVRKTPELFPMLIGIQAKHRQPGNKVGSQTVRLMDREVLRRQINAGLVITNTSFTSGANDVVRNLESLHLRLRDHRDLTRWFHKEYVTKSDWREMPQIITPCEGVKVRVPNPFDDKEKQLGFWVA